MTIPVEIMLRQNPEVFTRNVEHPGDPRQWAVDDVRAVLKAILVAVNGLKHSGEQAGPVSLRGLSWIVSPYQDGVVIAFEIHSASVVAGPFHVDEPLLTALVAGAVAADRPVTVHCARGGPGLRAAGATTLAPGLQLSALSIRRPEPSRGARIMKSPGFPHALIAEG